MYDIIIIGGGISGLNTALNLSKNKKVLLCEKNNSFGGRIYTDKFLINKEKYSLEAGAGRISKSHKQMINLIKKMNLYNKLVEIDAEIDFYPSKNYSLKDKFNNNTGYDLIDKVLKQTKTISKEKLISMTFEELSSLFLKKEELKFMLDSCGYYGDLKIQNAYTAIDVFKKSIRTDKKYLIMKGGFSQLIDKMTEFIKKQHTCLTNTNCKELYYNDEVFTLNINNKKILCKQLVLAIPKENLLEFSFLRPYFPLLKSIYCIPLMRIYSIYRSQDVWFHNIRKSTTNNNLKYIIPIDPVKGVIMTSYTDHTYADYWKKNSSNKKKLDKLLKDNIKNVFHKSTKTPLDIKSYYWSCGVGLWKAGYNTDKIIKEIIHPNKKIPLFIIGENYSKYQGWMEGALDTSNRCISKLNI